MLNLAAPEAPPTAVRRAPGEVALELQKTMLRLKGKFMSEDGKEIHYKSLRESQLFTEYQTVARELIGCDLPALHEEDERKAFFISIQLALSVH